MRRQLTSAGGARLRGRPERRRRFRRRCAARPARRAWPRRRGDPALRTAIREDEQDAALDREAFLADHCSRGSVGRATTRRSPPLHAGGAVAAAEQLRGTAPDDPIQARRPLANVKPRLRMTTLYFLANSLDYLVAGTGNRSELSIGYFTKHGDGGCDLLPIGHLREERGARAGARAERAVRDRRADAERGIVAWSERRRRNGLHLRGAGALSRGRSAGRLPGARDENRAAHSRVRTQARSCRRCQTCRNRGDRRERRENILFSACFSACFAFSAVTHQRTCSRRPRP